MGIVYRATCLKTRKAYIGQTTKSLKERKRCHAKDAVRRTTYFCKALRKYGVDGFVWEVLWEGPDEDLYAKEQELIRLYNTRRPHGYNLADRGPGTHGVPISAAVRRRMSKARKGKPMAEETKRKIAATLKNREFSEEHRAKLSAAGKGRKPSPKQLAHIRNLNKGRKASPETRAKMSAARKGRRVGGPTTPESRAKISVAIKGRKYGPRSAEWKAMMSEKMKGNTYWKHRKPQVFTPEVLARMSAAQKGKKRGPQSPEHVAKRIAASLATKEAKRLAAVRATKG